MIKYEAGIRMQAQCHGQKSGKNSVIDIDDVTRADKHYATTAATLSGVKVI